MANLKNVVVSDSEDTIRADRSRGVSARSSESYFVINSKSQNGVRFETPLLTPENSRTKTLSRSRSLSQKAIYFPLIKSLERDRKEKHNNDNAIMNLETENLELKNQLLTTEKNLKEVFHIENQKLLDMLNESEKEVECIKEIMKNNVSNKDIILDLQSQIQQLKTEIFDLKSQTKKIKTNYGCPKCESPWFSGENIVSKISPKNEDEKNPSLVNAINKENLCIGKIEDGIFNCLVVRFRQSSCMKCRTKIGCKFVAAGHDDKINFWADVLKNKWFIYDYKEINKQLEPTDCEVMTRKVQVDYQQSEEKNPPPSMVTDSNTDDELY
jgi:hypothetical protein